MYFYVLCIVCFVSFSVLFVCICVLNYCHRVATQLQLNISYHISYHTILYHTISYHLDEQYWDDCVLSCWRCLSVLWTILTLCTSGGTSHNENRINIDILDVIVYYFRLDLSTLLTSNLFEECKQKRLPNRASIHRLNLSVECYINRPRDLNRYVIR